MKTLLSTWTGRIGVILFALLLMLAVIGPLLSDQDPNQLNPQSRLQAPDKSHPLGTDNRGRDSFARIANGTKTTLFAVFLVVAGTLTISMFIGLVSGLAGGVVDAILMRLVDILLAIPELVVALAVLGVLGPGFQNLLLALAASSWAYLARVARLYVVQARNRPDIWADRLAGVSTARWTLGHIVPHLASQLMIVATLRVGGVVMSFAGLSFLGLGAQPGEAEWGAMLSEARIYIGQAPWLLIAPSICILITIAAANLCADALRDEARV